MEGGREGGEGRDEERDHIISTLCVMHYAIIRAVEVIVVGVLQVYLDI